MSSIFDVVVMGTSLTTDTFSRGWVAYLQRALQEGKRSRVRALAMGKSAQSSNWGISNIQPVINLKPKVLLIEFINDAYAPYQSTPPENMTLSLSASNLNGIIDAVQAGSPDTIIYLMTLVKPTAAAKASLYPNLDNYDAQLQFIAAARGVGFIDLRGAWGNPADHPGEYPADGVHVFLPAHLRVTVPVLKGVLSPLFD